MLLAIYNGYSIFLPSTIYGPLGARATIAKGLNFLADFPFSCRKASAEHSFLRELVISFGVSGYVALFEIEDSQTITVLAIRHQREEDFF